MKKLISLLMIFAAAKTSQTQDALLIASFEKSRIDQTDSIPYKKALVSYDDFELLMEEVKAIRSKNLISFDQFLELQSQPNTIVLDARSGNLYQGKHVKGAINLPFTDFTQDALRRFIPDVNTRIIIYCNNNFEDDPVFFKSKTFNSDEIGKSMIVGNRKPIMLALNVPTYITLFGYGYRNIFELDELLRISDPRLKLEGTNGLELNLSNLRLVEKPKN